MKSAWFDRLSIAVGLIKCDFQSIESNFRSIKNRSKSFLKTLVFHVFVTIQTFQKFFLSLSSFGQGSKKNFLSFSFKFLQGFLTSKAGKTFLPFLFHLFFMFHAFIFILFGKISKLRKIWFLLISIFSFKIDHWVFVMRCY